MDRRRAICGLAAPAPLVAVALLACTSLKDAAETTDGGADATLATTADAHVVTDGAPPPPIPTADAGPPPPDSACGVHDEWIATTKATPGCEPRQVIVVDGSGAIDVKGISLARTPAGRVAISYNSELPTGGEWRVAQLTPTAPGRAAPTVASRNSSDITHDGLLSRVIGLAPDTIRAITFDVDDSDQTGAVHVAEVASGGALPASGDLVLDGVKSPSEIGYAIDPSGAEYVTVRFATTDANTAKLLGFTRPPSGGAFSPLPDLYPALKPESTAGAGATSLVVDARSQLHVLFHQNAAPGDSTARHLFLAANTWSDPKTVDQGPGDYGINPRLAISGDRKYALYFARAGGGSGTTADLRLATWDAQTDTPQITIVDQGISSNDALHPVYRAAMAIDKYGLVHIAEIAPDTSSETSGALRYWHQHVTAGGTDWLVDVVDPNVLSQLATAEVDLVVDDGARPHIAYASGVDGKVRYATRYDR